MADISAALIGLLGVLAGGYFNNFLAEDYRRFRDGQALAGALAGELESHGEPIPKIKNGLETMLPQSMSENGLNLPEWPIPPSPLFDENASKIGLLGPQTARDVAYVYENLRAFRQNFHMLSKHHRDMPKDWGHAMVVGCLAAITRSETRGVALVDSLKRQADESYWDRPETHTKLKWGAGIIAVFLIALKLFG
jgi:hypothetical protein